MKKLKDDQIPNQTLKSNRNSLICNMLCFFFNWSFILIFKGSSKIGSFKEFRTSKPKDKKLSLENSIQQMQHSNNSTVRINNQSNGRSFF